MTTIYHEVLVADKVREFNASGDILRIRFCAVVQGTGAGGLMVVDGALVELQLLARI
jgi:hypothetical protein